MSDTELDQAIERLRAHGGYGWLLDGPEAWLASDVADQLNAMGLPVTSNAITSWVKDLPSAQDFGRYGRSVSRTDLIKMLADRFTRKASNH